MSVTKVHSIRSVQSLVYYLLYGRGKQYRNNIKNGTNRAAAMFSTATTDQLAAFGQQITQSYGRKVQAFSYVQSFSRDEFDIRKPEDVQTVNDLGFELAQRMHPEAHTLVVTHIDGKGGCLHNHIVILNHNQQTGTALRGYQLARQVRAANDQLMKEHGLKVVTSNRRKTSQREYWLDRKSKLGRNDWETWLKNTLDWIIARENPTSLEDYTRKCAARHIIVKQTDHDGHTGLVYHVRVRRADKNGKPVTDRNGRPLTRTRRRKASKLGDGYTIYTLSLLFIQNIRRLQQEADEKRRKTKQLKAQQITEERDRDTIGQAESTVELFDRMTGMRPTRRTDRRESVDAPVKPRPSLSAMLDGMLGGSTGDVETDRRIAIGSARYHGTKTAGSVNKPLRPGPRIRKKRWDEDGPELG